MKLEICNFSGYKIYPGRGKLFIRGDSKSFRLLNGKCESHFLQKLNPRKFQWTQVFRRMHKKGITEEIAKKRTRRAVKMQKSFVGASIEEIKAKRNQSSDLRVQARQKALKEAKEKKQQDQSQKRAEKAKVAAASRTAQPTASKSKGTSKPQKMGKAGKR